MPLAGSTWARFLSICLYRLFIFLYILTGEKGKIKMPTIESEPYENLRKLRDITTEETLRALDEVKRFLLERRHIITGGQAIDYALRLKGSHIYDDNEVPDYDILTDKFHTEAYDLAQILHDKGFTNVSAINAMHPSTMRVFVNGTSVCDLTYVPKISTTSCRHLSSRDSVSSIRTFSSLTSIEHCQIHMKTRHLYPCCIALRRT